MALKTTNKNRKPVTFVQAKVESHNHEQQAENIAHTPKKSNHKLFFVILGLIAVVAFFVV